MLLLPFFSFFFFFNDTATTEIYTLSLPTLFRSLRGAHGSAPAEERHRPAERSADRPQPEARARRAQPRSEEHTSELQSPCNLVCRLLLEKKKKNTKYIRDKYASRMTRSWPQP